jgi:translation initiation factor 2B subunit (eIF-2B alpha/beta/delta family)
MIKLTVTVVKSGNREKYGVITKSNPGTTGAGSNEALICSIVTTLVVSDASLTANVSPNNCVFVNADAVSRYSKATINLNFQVMSFLIALMN